MATFKQRLGIATKAAVGIFSDNAAQAAYGMLAGIYPGGLGQPPARGTRQYLLAYSQMPWLRACASRIAHSVASVEWQLFVTQKQGSPKAYQNKRLQYANGKARSALKQQLQQDNELKQITDHPLLDLLNDANSFQTGGEMRKITQLHMDLVGEAFWLKERASGGPLNGAIVGLWPIPPDWVLNTPTPMNRVFRVGFRGWRGLIPDTEFVWMKDSDPSNPYARGTGTAQAMADELETDEYAAKHIKSFFYNQARPDMLIYPKMGQMREPDVKRLEDDWISRNTGFWRAFKPYFLTREVGIQTFDQNFRSMQFVQIRQHERDVIMQIYGIPPELLGVLNNSNRATISAADLIFNRYVVEPRLQLLRSVWQERLIPEFDERLVLEYVSPVQDDKDFELEVAASQPWILSMDEWRDMAGKDPMDDEKQGNLRAVPNLVSIKDFDDPNALNPPPPPVGIPGAPPRGPEEVPPPTAGRPPAPGGPPKPPRPDQEPAGPPKPAQPKPLVGEPKAKDFNPDEPRDDHGRWTNGEDVGHISTAPVAAGEHTQRILSPGQHNALTGYTDGRYHDINIGLREYNGNLHDLSSSTERDVHNLDAAIEKGTLSEHHVFFRGSGMGHFNGLKVGDTFSDQGFVSMTDDANMATNFSGTKGKLIEVEVPKGAHVLDVANSYRLSGHSDRQSNSEHEFLLGRGHTFRVLSADYSGPLKRILVRMIS